MIPTQDALVDDTPAWLDVLPGPVVIVGSEGNIRACNQTAHEQFGEVIGRPFEELFDADSRELLQRTLRMGWKWAAERRYRLADGHPVELRSQRMVGRTARWLVQIGSTKARDVLDEARDLRHRSDTLAGLAGAVARELNDPMSIVQGRLELLLELGVTDADVARHHLHIALEHARRISATLRNLRLVGRTSHPGTHRVAISDVVAEALELVGSRGREVEIVVQPPELATSGEQAMYARVFANLLRHALERAPRSARVILQARAERDEVHVHIVTRGGLREHDSTIDTFDVDRAMLAGAGGRIERESRPGESRIVLRLPPALHRRARALPAEERVLVVGAEAFFRRVEALLQDEGFELVGAPTADAAIDLLDRAEPPIDRVLTELWLDGPSGLALARVLVERRADLEGRIAIAAHAPLEGLPGGAISLVQPLGRRPLLEALGRRVR